jgi:prophage regulatory protein
VTIWRMEIETEPVPDTSRSGLVEALLEELARRSHALAPIGRGPGASLGAVFEIEANTPQQASALGIRTFQAALVRATEGVVEPPTITRMELSTGVHEPLELLGATDVASLLGVSRQRVYQLMTSYADFPRPTAELARGSIWSRREIEAWRDEKQQSVPWIADLVMKVRVQPPRVNAPGKNNRDLLVRWVEVMGNRHGVPSEAAWLNGIQLWARFALDAVTLERAAESAADLITWKAQNANIAIQRDLDVEFRSVEPLNAP